MVSSTVVDAWWARSAAKQSGCAEYVAACSRWYQSLAGGATAETGQDDARLIISVIIILIEMREWAGLQGEAEVKGLRMLCVKTLPEIGGNHGEQRRAVMKF